MAAALGCRALGVCTLQENTGTESPVGLVTHTTKIPHGRVVKQQHGSTAKGANMLLLWYIRLN